MKNIYGNREEIKILETNKILKVLGVWFSADGNNRFCEK